MFLPIGTVLQGKYRIDSHIASGGFGNTYVVTHLDLDDKMAVKEFFMKGVNHREGDGISVSVSNPDSRFMYEAQKSKFRKEAQRIRKLKDPHIVKVSDLFEENNTCYYVMDFIDGESLGARQKSQGHPFSEDEVLDILNQMLSALQTIHAQNIWHMDIKPDNILIDSEGHCTLIDFGASKQTATSDGMTTSTALSYTPGYAPFEQLNGSKDRWGPWTDFYALGATMYNLLTGNNPPLDSDENSFVFPDTVSKATKGLVLWMMKLIWKDRPQSVEEIRAYLTKGYKEFKTPPEPQDDNTKPLNSDNTKPLNGTPEDESTKSGAETVYGPISAEELLVGNKNEELFTVNGVSFKMIFVQGGTFLMGATSEQGLFFDNDEKPAHSVTLNDYYIGQTLVTQELWQAVMGNNPSWFIGNNLLPVENVSWNDCVEFISKLRSKTGKMFRLPTEAEWEFAARGGLKSRGYKYSGSNDIGVVAWYNYKTHPVATKAANELGIYDMSGNVYEWCNDWYDKNYYSNSPSSNPQGPSSGSNRVFRGGSWDDDAWYCRVTNRFGGNPGVRNSSLGLRLAL